MRKHAPPCGVYMRKHAPPRLAGRGTPRRKVQASDTSDVPLIACRCVWVWGVTEREREREREEEKRERERGRVTDGCGLRTFLVQRLIF
jgi:hypothetical protein